jgi:hypothetical protein
MSTSLRVLRNLLFILLILPTLSSTRYSGLLLEDSTLRQVDVWETAHSFSRVYSLQRAIIDQVEMCLHLSEGVVLVSECAGDPSREIWRSPEAWQVQEAFFSDLDLDGALELALLVWRAFNPWPVDQFMPYGGRIDAFKDDEGNSCHLILLSLEEGNPEEIWAGSALANPMHSLLAEDLDGDGLQELAAIEYAYDSTTLSGQIVVWEWNGFGFSLVDRMDGTYASMHVLSREESMILLALND